MLIGIVRLAMQGPLQALLFSSVFFISDITSWISLSLVTLLVMRKGFQSAALICLALLGLQFLPGIGLRFIDAMVLLTLLIAGQTLRATMRLDVALLLVAVVACVVLALTHFYAAHVFAPFTEAFVQTKRLFPELAKVLTEDNDTYVLRSVGSWVVIKASIILLLARYWQSVLYNPQGFVREFLALRMSLLLAGVWLLMLVLVQMAPQPLNALSSALRVPFLLAGIAICYWSFQRFAIKLPWRVLFSMALLVIHPLVVLVGALDSISNFRYRFAAKPPESQA